MGKRVADLTDEEILAAVERHNGVAAYAAEALRVPHTTLRTHLRAIREGRSRPSSPDSPRPVDEETALEAYAAAGMNVAEAARRTGIPERTLRRRIDGAGDVPARIEAMDGFRPRPLMGLVRVSGNGLALGDIHLPITRFDIVAAAVRSAVLHGCTDWCVIAGDLFNFDALSDYFPKQGDHELDVEIRSGRDLLLLLLEVFGVVVVTKGNHDIRLQKAMGFRLKFEHTLRMFLPGLPDGDDERLLLTGRDYAIVDTPEGEWRLCHTRQYSETPLAVPIKIADVNQQHVAGYHRHHYAVGFSRSGKMVVEGGGAFDTDRTEYLKQWSTTHPRWQPGWTLLKDGKPHLPMLAPCPTCD